jgi:glycosyltransferase involved in cell wall biosynthesis
MFLDKIKELVSADKIDDKSRVMFVNDGSKDTTWEIIKDLAKQDEHFVGITQSRNRGHQNAVLAGLMEAKDLCDITISIDCDGQDDINAMNEMVDAYADGCGIVYGVRNKRDTDTSGNYIGQFKIKFDDNISIDGMTFPKGELIAPIAEDLIITISDSGIKK